MEIAIMELVIAMIHITVKFATKLLVCISVILTEGAFKDNVYVMMDMMGNFAMRNTF